MRKSGILGILGAVMILAGCAGYEAVASRSIDDKFELYAFTWTSGTVTAVALSAFEDDGRLALCGAYTSDIGSFDKQKTRQYFDTSNIYIGEDRVGPMSFANSISVSHRHFAQDPDEIPNVLSAHKANCVRTKTAWETRFANEKISWKGPRRIVVFD